MLCLPLLLGAVVAGGACHDATEGGARPWASLAVQPVLPATVIPGQFDLAVDRARIRLTRAPAETVLDTLVFFPVGASQLTVRLRVPLVARRERLAASLELASGARLLFAGTDTVEVSESESLAPPIRLQYVGPGADISRLLIVPRDTALKPGDTFTFGVTAEASGVPVTQFYVNWSSSDPQLAAVNAVGTLTAPAQRGTIHLRVVSPTGIKDSTQIFFSPPPSSMARFGGDRQTWFAGLQLPQPLAVRVLAADSEGAPGVRVSFRSLSGGRVTDAVATTGMDGVARTVAILGPSAGIQGFEASAPGLAPLTFTATAQVGPPARIETLAGNAQTDSVGRTLATPLIARVTDFVGNPIAGVTLNWQVVAGGGTLDRTSSITNLSGIAFADYTLGSFPGTNVVRATVTAPPLAVDFTATAIPGSPFALLSLGGGGQSDTAGATLAPFVAVATDRFTNLLPGIAVRWSEVQGGGVLSPTTATTDALGRAATVYRLPTTAGTVNVVAEIPGTAISQVFSATVTPATPFALALSGGGGQSAPAGSVLAPFAVRVTDRFGNPAPGAVVSWEVLGGGGSLSGTNSAADAAGVARVTYTLGPAPGPNSVRAALAAGATLTVTATATP
jgi:hypothetical protein